MRMRPRIDSILEAFDAAIGLLDDQGQLRRSFAAYLAVDRDLAAELRVRCDRADDPDGIRLRICDAPGGAPAVPVSFGDPEWLDAQPRRAHLGVRGFAPPSSR